MTKSARFIIFSPFGSRSLTLLPRLLSHAAGEPSAASPGLDLFQFALLDEVDHRELAVVLWVSGQPHVAAIGAHLPSRVIGLELHVEHRPQFLAQGRIFD